MARHVVKIVVFVLLCSGLFGLPVSAGGNRGNVSGAFRFEILEDMHGEYSFATVSAPETAAKFTPYLENTLCLGLTKSVYWVRFKLTGISVAELKDGRLLELNNPNIDNFNLYIPVADNNSSTGFSYGVKEAGLTRTKAVMDVRYSTWVFRLPPDMAAEEYLYLRLDSSAALRIPIVLWRVDDFLGHVFLHQLGFGVFSGILLAMLSFNLCIYFALREKTYLYYVLYIGSMLLYQFQIHGCLSVLADIPYKLHNTVYEVVVGMTFIFSCYFTRCFLQTSSATPGLDKVLTAIVALAALQSMLGIAGYTFWANQIAHAIGLFGPVFIVMLAAIRLRQGFRPARYYLVAWGTLSCGVLLWVLSAFVVQSLAVVNYLLLATAGETIFLSFALADRVRCLHQEYYKKDKEREVLLQENERITTYANDGVVLVNEAGIIVEVNNRAQKIYGFSEAEFIGRKFLSLFQESLEKEPITSSDSCVSEAIHRRKDGADICVEISSGAIVRQGQKEYLHIIRDVTERRRIEKEMQRLDQLGRVGEIAAGIGHEIRNPMTTVRGYLQMLERKPALGVYKDQFELMIEELDRANTIITEFLSLAKTKATDKICRNINDILRVLLPLLQVEAIRNSKDVILETGDVPCLMLDEKEMRQLVLNLAFNGLEAMKSGGVLKISTRAEEKTVILSVEDHGHGITADWLDKLGTPFLTSKPSGTGLGLAICYSIATRHKAVIEITSSPQGTTVNVVFQVPKNKKGLAKTPPAG